MLGVTIFLILSSYAAPARAVARPPAVIADNRVPLYKAFAPTSEIDVTQKINRRTQSDVTIQGPSGGIATGNVGGNGSGLTNANQGSSGTIVAGNHRNTGADTVVPVELKFSGVPPGYQLLASTRDSIISYVRQLLENSLDSAFQLVDVSYVGTLSNGGRYRGQNINGAGGVQNQYGQTVWNNQNSGGGDNWRNGPNGRRIQNGNGSGSGVGWGGNGSGNDNNWNNNGDQNNNIGGHNGGQNGQNQNGQSSSNDQNRNSARAGGTDIFWAVNGNNNNDGQNNNNGGQNGQNQNGQTPWNNQNGNGAGAGATDIYWAVNGNNNNNNGEQNGQNQNGQTSWNNQNGNGGNANGSGAGIDWASNGSSNGNNWNNNGGQNNWQNGQNGGQNQIGQAATDIYWAVNGQNNNNNGNQNGAQEAGPTPISLPLHITVNSSPELSSSASSYIVQALLNNIQIITNYVRTLDSVAFTYAILMVETVDSANEPRPTSRPSQKPTREPVAPDDEVEKTFPMQFNLDGIAPGYIPSTEHQISILGFIEDMIRNNLEPPLELSVISYLNNGNSRHLTTARRLQESLYLPTDVTLKGPANAIDDGYPELLDVAEKHMEEVVEDLQDMDPETFEDVEVSSEAFDVMDLNSDTNQLTHPVQFVFNNVEEGYELSKQGQTYFISYVKQLLNSNIGLDWELIHVAYARRFELDVPTPQLPLRVTVKGPAEKSDQSLSDIMEVLERHKQDLRNHLTPLDGNIFEDVRISIGSTDLPDIEVPTFVSDHPVQVVIKNAKPGYVLTTDIQESIVGYVKELVTEYLDGSLELIDVKYAGTMGSGPGRNSLSLPLRITVRGDAEASEKTVPYVIKIVEEYNLNFKDFLLSLDQNAFGDAKISAESFQFDSIIEPDAQPEEEFGMKKTVHHVQFIFKNASNGYRLSDADRASMIRSVKELLDKNLDESLELVRVAYAGDTGAQSLPLRITVKGPADEADFALAFVMDVLRDHRTELQMLVKSLDWNELKNVGIAIESFDPALLIAESEPEMVEMEETEHPVQLVFKNLAPGTRFSRKNRGSILHYVEELIEANIAKLFQLVDVTDASKESDVVSLPLLVAVKGPADKSELAPAYVMEVLEDHKHNIEMYIKSMLAKSLDWNDFKNIDVSVETYDPALVNTEADVAEMEETEHPVKLIIEDVPPGSSLSQDDRASILEYLKKLMEDNLAEPIQLVEVNDESGEMDTLSLPLRFAVEAPADESELVPGYVMEVLEDHKEDIERMLKGLDWGTFNDANVRFENNDNYVPPPTPGMVETTHLVRLNLDNVPAGYSLSQSDKASIVGFSEQLLDDNLNELFERVEVADVSNGRNRGLLSPSVEKTRRLDTASLPLLVTVKGPADKSDLAPAYVMEVFENYKEDLEKMLRTLDWDTFKDVDMRAEIGDNNPPTTDTVHPIQLNLENIPSGYNLSRRDRAHIERFTKELLEKNLNDPLELVKVAHAVNCNDRKLHSSRRLGTTLLPLRVTVRAPTDESDFALSYVMDVLDEYNQDLVRMLKTLDWVVFDAVRVSLNTHDLKCSNGPMEETSHPVQLNFENLPAGYPLYRKDRPSIIRFVKKLVGDDIDESFELIEVADDMKRRSLFSSLSGNIRRLDTVSLPLLFTVNGPADQSDFAPVYVLQAIRENLEDIEEYLKSLDSRTFKNVIVTIGPYDDIDDDEEDMDTPWWVWFLVAMGLLLFIICFFMCCCAYKRYKNDKKILKSVEEVVEFTDHSSSDKDTASVPVIEQNHHALFPYTPHQIEDEHRETLQIIPHVSDASIPTQQADDSTDMYTIQFFDDGSSAFAQQSAITFALDPPSECNLKLESREVLLALQPPTKEPTPLYADPRSHHTDQSSITSVIASHTNKSQNWFEVYRDFEDQPLVLDEPSLHHPNEKPSYATQPNIVQAVPSVNDDPNALVLYENGENQTVDVEEPSGRYYIEENQSYRSEAQPHANQELRKLPGWEDDVSSYTTQPHMKSDVTNLRSVASSIAHGDGKKKKKKQRNNNRRATMSHIDEQQSYATQSQGHLVQDPGGVFEWDDEASSYITELPPTRTKSFFTQPHTIRSVESSVMPGGPEGGKKQRRSRRGKNSVPQTDGVSSRTGTNNQYYGHSNTFYV